jgi:hypothetical protein
VHGIGNVKYGSSAAISAEWSQWLGEDVSVAYYAQHLHRGTPQGADDPATMAPGEQELLANWVELLAPQQVSQGPRTARARQAADWLTRHFGATARTFAMAFTREVHTYLSERDTVRRSKARLEVANTIAEHQPAIVIAHSLGSVVAYETLWAYPQQQVDLLITVGSPLAMPGVVRPRLRPVTVDRRPPGVRRWVNLADVGDLVALPRGGLRFQGVERDAEVVIGDWDFHTARNYLGCAAVRELIRLSPKE